MRDQLFQSISLAESRHANCVLIVAGDLNRLDIKSLKKHFRLKQIVKKPTRKNAILDLVLTSLHKYYDEPRSFPPFDLSDNNTLQQKLEWQKVVKTPILKRGTRAKSQNRLGETSEC